MNRINVNKSSGFIEYDDDKNIWSADVIFNSEKKEILIMGTTRCLTDEERSNIITAILNKYYFGNYLNYEHELYKYKLKNRSLDKKQEKNIKERAYSMLGEDIIELEKNNEECERITEYRRIFLHLKIAVKEAKISKVKLNDKVTFVFEGSKLEFKKYRKVLDDLIPEFEHALSKLYGKKVTVDYDKNIKKGKIAVTFNLKEA